MTRPSSFPSFAQHTALHFSPSYIDYGGKVWRVAETVNDRLARLESKFDSFRNEQKLREQIAEERWAKVELAMNFGDAQGQQALTLLTSMVQRQEENQRDLGKRIRAMEDTVLSFKTMFAVASSIGGVFGAVVAGVTVKLVGG